MGIEINISTENASNNDNDKDTSDRNSNNNNITNNKCEKNKKLPKVKPPAKKRIKRFIPKDDMGRHPWDNNWSSQYDIVPTNAIPPKRHISKGKFKKPVIVRSV